MNPVRASLIRLRVLLGKEFLQLLRDPRMRFFMIVPPLFQLMAFGYAASFDVRHAEIAIVDQARTATTRELLAAVAATGSFTLHYLPDVTAASAAIDRGQVRALLRFAPDFEIRRTAQIIADGSDSNSAQMIVGQLSQALQRSAQTSIGLDPPIQVEDRAWFNDNLDDRSYFVPGIIATIVLITTVILIAMTIVREREFGTLERVLVTPVARLEVLVARMAAVASGGPVAYTHLGVYKRQRFSLYGVLTVLENLKLQAGLYGLSGLRCRDRIDAALRLLNLTDRQTVMAGTLPLGYHCLLYTSRCV